MIRKEARLEFADKINVLNKSELWDMGISRVSEVTGLDVVGCPVWVSCRPLSRTVSLNAGKSLDRMMSRAGAILEASEFCAAEIPKGESMVAPYSEVKDKAVDYRSLPLIHSSILHEDMPIEWEWSTEILSGQNKLVPSGACWMHPRTKTFIGHFQNSSNGNASGYSIVDAIISGLYEVVERDAWTISEHLESHKIVENLPESIKSMEEMAKRSALKLSVFSCTQEDIGIPVFGAVVHGDDAGLYTGHGCNRCPIKAMERAVLEAFQSRCVYIAGARDDLFRRSFLISKNTNPKDIETSLGKLGRDDTEYQELGDVEDSQELIELSRKVKDAGLNDIYVKHLNTFEFKDVTIPVVKVIVPGLETCKMDGQWTPSPRCLKKKSLFTSAQA
jgi:YcaO-like protein with predicted kinase domain